MSTDGTTNGGKKPDKFARRKPKPKPPRRRVVDRPYKPPIMVRVPAPPPDQPPDSELYQYLPSTLDFLFYRIRGGPPQAIKMACYGSRGDERAEAIAEAYENARTSKARAEFSLEDQCRLHKIRESEYIGMVVAGLAQFKEDYTEIIKAQEVPELLEKSFEFSKKEENFQERHEHLKAAGHHLAPKAAQVVVDNRDQRTQIVEMGGLPTMEEGLRSFEEIGQRRLPPSTAAPVELEATESVPVERRDE